MAGILAARTNNKVGIAGVSRAKIYAVKVLDATGFGTHWDVAQGIRKAADRTSVRVINVSLGGEDPSTTLQDAVEYAVVTKGKLLVAAAGNSDPGVLVTTPFYPAAYSVDYPERVMAVAASGIWVVPSSIPDPDPEQDSVLVEDCRADYSYYGDFVNITAPGTDIYSTQPWKKDFYLHRYFGYDPDLTGYEYLSGTSMAAPHVAAVAARIIGNNPKFTNVAGLPPDGPPGLHLQGRSADRRGRRPHRRDRRVLGERLHAPHPGGADPVPGRRGRRPGPRPRARHRPRPRREHGPRPERRPGAPLQEHRVGDRGLRRAHRGGGLLVLRHHQRALERPDGNGAGGRPLSPADLEDRVHGRGVRRGLQGGRRLEARPDHRLPERGEPGPRGEHPSLDPEQLVRHGLGGVGRAASTASPPSWTSTCSGPSISTIPSTSAARSAIEDIIGADQCGPNGSLGTLTEYPWARWIRDGSPWLDAQGTETTAIKKLLKTTAGNEYRLMVTDNLDGRFESQRRSPVVRLWKGGVLRATVRFDPGDGHREHLRRSRLRVRRRAHAIGGTWAA